MLHGGTVGGDDGGRRSVAPTPTAPSSRSPQRLGSWTGSPGRRTHLREATQADIDDWLTSSVPSAHSIRDFLGWAREHRHCSRFVVPAPGRRTGLAIARRAALGTGSPDCCTTTTSSSPTGSAALLL